MLNMFRTLIYPSSGACDFSILSPHWLCVLVPMCVGVSMWLGWCGIRFAGFHFLCAQHVSDTNISIIRSLRLFCWITTLFVLFLFRCVLEFRYGWVGVVSVLQAEAYNTDTTPPQPNRNLTQIHIEPEQYNPWNNSTNKSQAPEDECINIWNMLSIK